MAAFDNDIVDVSGDFVMVATIMDITETDEADSLFPDVLLPIVAVIAAPGQDAMPLAVKLLV